ncbi:MAG: peptidoglycan editing factor PgeF [Actinobacteria bacterium]|nr:peptidoglycan editing factor PgeF [Actinomycetota bacterium]
MLTWQGEAGSVRFAVSDRGGGTSGPPYDSLNLALHVGDDPRAVAVNRSRLAAALGVVSIVWMEQVHGRTVAVVDRAHEVPPVADALVTRRRGLALAVLVADCTPVLVADPDAGVIGVAHAGRRGLAAGVVPALVAAMVEQGGQHLQARIGPSICARCYPVPAKLQAEVAGVVPAARARTRDGSPALAISLGVRAQLTAAGVAVQTLPGCSAEDSTLFSYRRADGRTGRYGGFAWLA